MDILYKSKHIRVMKQVMSNAMSLVITKTMVLRSRQHVTTDVNLLICVLLCLAVQMTYLHYWKSPLQQMVAALPIGKYIVCMFVQNIYSHNSYNYDLSQLPIRIEQTYGYMMTNKVAYFAMTTSIQAQEYGQDFLCITCLHNFLINEGNKIPPPPPPPPPPPQA